MAVRATIFTAKRLLNLPHNDISPLASAGRLQGICRPKPCSPLTPWKRSAIVKVPLRAKSVRRDAEFWDQGVPVLDEGIFV